MLATTSPYPQYFDLDGSPLDAGYVYFGLANQDPQTSPKQVYWDADGTIPAAQPVRTLNGYPARSGSPALLFVDGDYSALVQDKKRRQVAYAAAASTFSNALIVQEELTDFQDAISGPSGSDLLGFTAEGVGAEPRTSQDKMREVVSGEDYGAIGNGSTNDTASLQAWANSVCTRGGAASLPFSKTYLITSPIVFKPQIPDGYNPPYPIPSDILFEPIFKVLDLFGNQSKIVAGAAMDCCFLFEFNGPIDALAPFFSRIRGFYFDLANLAGVGIKLSYCHSFVVEQCRFDRGPVGIENNGYGVVNIGDCVFRTDLGIDNMLGGSDSIIGPRNDFYVKETGIKFGMGAALSGNGNTRVFSNVFTFEDLVGDKHAAIIDGGTGGAIIRDITFLSNEFSGATHGVKIVGDAARNIRDITLIDNHVIPYGTNDSAGLVDAVNTVGLKLIGNRVGLSAGVPATGVALLLQNSSAVEAIGNTFQNSEAIQFELNNVVDSIFVSNIFRNVGDQAANNGIVRFSNCVRNRVSSNKFIQDNTTDYAQFGVVEIPATGCAGNMATDNDAVNITGLLYVPDPSSTSSFANRVPEFLLSGCTVGNVAQNSTNYLGANGVQATNIATAWVIPVPCVIDRIYVATGAAPGVGQSNTYTVFVNGAPTTMIATSTGNASFTAISTTNPVTLAADDQVSIRVVTSATANVAQHRYSLRLRGRDA